MAASKSVNTMAEILKGVMQDLQLAKMMPDADLSFLVSLETQILSYLKQPLQNMAGQLPPNQLPSSNPGNMPGGGGMPSGTPAGMDMSQIGPLPSSPMGARMAGGGPPGGGQPPNMDEMRRLMGGVQ